MNRIFAACILMLLTTGSFAQTLLQTPKLELRAIGSVNTIVATQDGGAIVGGFFTEVDGVSRAGLAKIRPDGTLDLTWNPTAVGTTIRSLLVDGEQNLYVGGSFSTIGGAARSNLAKLRLDSGAAVTTWIANTDLSVTFLAFASDGAVLATGPFSQLNGVARSRLARVSASTGSLDTNFVPLVNSQINAMVVGENGEIFIGGSFSQVNGAPRNRIAKLLSLGTLDASWNPGANGTVDTLALESGALFAGGTFSQLGGQNRRLAKISPLDGAVDAAWNVSVDSFPVGGELVGDGAGNLFVSGVFSFVNGVSRPSLARVSAFGAGTLDTSFAPTFSANARVSRVTRDSSGRLFLGGQFTAVNGADRIGFASLNSAGQITGSSIGLFSEGAIQKIARLPNNDFAVLGNFIRVGSIIRPGLAKIAANGELDAQWAPVFDRTPTTLVADATGALYLGGDFLSVNGVPRNRLAKLRPDGQLDTSWSANANSTVFGLSLKDNKLYATGGFTSINGTTRNGIAAVESGNGSLVSDFVANVLGNQTVLYMTTNADSIFVAGSFTSVNGATASGIAKLNAITGALDPAFAPVVPSNSLAGLQFHAGQLYLHGSFNQINGLTRNRLARMDSAGALDSSYTPSVSNRVQALTFDPAGNQFLGMEGVSSTVNGVARMSAAKLDPAGMLDDWAPNVVQVSELLVDADRVFLGGFFNSVSNQSRTGFAAVSAVANPASVSLIQLRKRVVMGSTLPSQMQSACSQASTQLVLPDTGGSIRYCYQIVNGDRTVHTHEIQDSALTTNLAVSESLAPGGTSLWVLSPEVSLTASQATAATWTSCIQLTACANAPSGTIAQASVVAGVVQATVGLFKNGFE